VSTTTYTIIIERDSRTELFYLNSFMYKGAVAAGRGAEFRPEPNTGQTLCCRDTIRTIIYHP